MVDIGAVRFHVSCVLSSYRVRVPKEAGRVGVVFDVVRRRVSDGAGFQKGGGVLVQRSDALITGQSQRRVRRTWARVACFLAPGIGRERCNRQPAADVFVGGPCGSQSECGMHPGPDKGCRCQWALHCRIEGGRALSAGFPLAAGRRFGVCGRRFSNERAAPVSVVMSRVTLSESVSTSPLGRRREWCSAGRRAGMLLLLLDGGGLRLPCLPCSCPLDVPVATPPFASSVAPGAPSGNRARILPSSFHGPCIQSAPTRRPPLLLPISPSFLPATLPPTPTHTRTRTQTPTQTLSRPAPLLEPAHTLLHPQHTPSPPACPSCPVLPCPQALPCPVRPAPGPKPKSQTTPAPKAKHTPPTA